MSWLALSENDIMLIMPSIFQRKMNISQFLWQLLLSQIMYFDSNFEKDLS